MKPELPTFLACDAPYEAADAVLLGVPFDGTTTFRPGARFGPAAMRGESFGLETYSPYCDRDLGERKICDVGDLELPFGNAQRVLDLTERAVDGILSDGKRPLLLGGEHLITLGAVRAALRRYPALHVIQFDAHTDLRGEYLGEELTHAGVMLQIWKLTGDGRVHQFGIRSGERAEFQFAALHTDLHRFSLDGFEKTVAGLAGLPVYVTVDLDVLDPGCFCGTGTPEPGGVSFSALLQALLALDALDIIGADVCELSPHYDPSGASTAAACKVVRELLLQLRPADAN